MSPEHNGLLSTPGAVRDWEGALGSRTPKPLSPRDGDWFNGTLEPFQRKGAAFLLDHPFAVLADDCGFGKTPTLLSYISRLEAQGGLERQGKSVCKVLWLTDLHQIESTRAEIERLLPTHSVLALSDPIYQRGSQAMRDAWKAEYGDYGPDILLVTYDDAVRNIDGLTRRTPQPALVVLDDANRFTGRYVVRRNAVSRITESARRVVSVTATPMWRDPMDLYTLLRVTRVPDLWPRSTYSQRFVSWLDKSGRARPDGWLPGRAAEVRDFLRTCMIQRSAREAGLTLPERAGELVRYVPLGPDQWEDYHAAELLDDNKRTKAMEAAGWGVRGFTSPLAEALVDELRQRDGRQVVVFYESPRLGQIVEDRLHYLGIPSARVDKDTIKRPRDRADAIARFREGAVRVLMGGELLDRGADLGNCNDAISLDVPWSASEVHQREGRVRRPSSPHSDFRHLILAPDHPLNRRKLWVLDHRHGAAGAIHLGKPEPRPSWVASIPNHEPRQ